jgi:hypothetical protein
MRAGRPLGLLVLGCILTLTAWGPAAAQSPLPTVNYPTQAQETAASDAGPPAGPQAVQPPESGSPNQLVLVDGVWGYFDANRQFHGMPASNERAPRSNGVPSGGVPSGGVPSGGVPSGGGDSRPGAPRAEKPGPPTTAVLPKSPAGSIVVQSPAPPDRGLPR